jgi:hypothetical protein
MIVYTVCSHACSFKLFCLGNLCFLGALVGIPYSVVFFVALVFAIHNYP